MMYRPSYFWRSMKTLFIVNLLAIFLVINSFAESQTAEQQFSSKQTQDLLKDQKKIKELSKENKDIKKADDFVKGVAGSDENTQAIYELAAEILPIFLEMNNNDPEKATKALAEYSKDPKAFLEKLPAATRKKIKDISTKIEAEKVKKP